MKARLVPFIRPQLLVPEARDARVITPRVAILHTHGSKGSPEQIGKFFDRPDIGTSSTVSIGWDDSRQFMPLDRQANANWDANSFSISIETQDDGNPLTPWNEYQVTMIARVLFFMHQEWNLPLVACPSPYGAGVGHHSLFYEWNKSRHGCPGRAREAQLYNVVLPRAIQLGYHPLPQPSNRMVTVNATLPVLRVDSRGPAVRKCKALLNILTASTTNVNDDHYGPTMAENIKRLQRFFGLPADGVCGERTWALLLNLPLS